MESTENHNHIDFDSIVSARQLQIMKAAIPYIPTGEQKFISMFVKLRELMNTYQLFNRSSEELVGICSVPEESRNPVEMLNAIKVYCNENETDQIDLMLNMLSAASIYNVYKKQSTASSTSSQNNFDFMSVVKGMLTPEQQTMFETYSSVLSGLS